MTTAAPGRELSPATSKQIDLMLAQYQLLSEDIRHLENAAERAFGVGIALVSGFLAFAYQERINEVYFVATPAYLGLLLYASNQWTSIFWKGGYKRHLEEKINTLAGADVLGWEQFAEHTRGKLSVTFSMFGLFLVAGMVAVFAVSCMRILEIFGLVPAAGFAAVCALLLASLVFSIMQGSKRFGETVRDAKALDALNAKAKAPPAAAKPSKR